MIELQGVAKRYGSTYAVRDISFTVEKGQVLGLLGQNGAGKTTTLGILTGYLSPSAGSVRVGGHDLLESPREAKRLLGYLPEHPPLYDEMTVTAYLRFVCSLKEVVPRMIPEHVAGILEATGLSDVSGRKLGNLSKGYRQRVGLAQALCANPEALVLDEPTVGLDPRQAAEFRTLVAQLSQSHTIIFSSHQLGEIQALCDRVVMLHRGKMICDERMENLTGAQESGVRLRASIALGSDRLLPALRSLPGVTRVKHLPNEQPGVTEVLLEAPRGTQPQRALFTLLCGLQAPILRLTPLHDTLEEIFLRLAAGADEAPEQSQERRHARAGNL